jgi:three-Cys-motif partner protein
LQLFGGDWTEEKLDALGRYLKAYLKVLLKQPFQTVYLDAFAGTGYREQRGRAQPAERNIFQELAEAEPQRFLDGSARIALKIQPGFSRYIFIELNQQRATELEKLKIDFPQRAAIIEVRRQDANAAIQQICQSWDARRSRGVLFLDPFGMQADWATIEAIAATKAIDVWILFPFAVNRLLTRNPKDLQPGWRERLNRVFGSEEWYNRFYVERRIEQFFGEPETVVEKNLTLAGLAAYYKERLESVFPMIAPNPRILRNTRNAPLFQLFFAASNPGNGGKIAVKIARHILEKI